MWAMASCCAAAVEGRKGDGGVHGMSDKVTICGGHFLRGADEQAVDGVDGYVIVRQKGLDGEVYDGLGEGGLQIVGITFEIEDDREVDGVVRFESDMSGMKERASVKADFEVFAVEGRKRSERWAQHQGWDLHDIDVGVEREDGGGNVA